MEEPIRVVALIDMDAFYTQVEEREQPHFRGRPLAVVPFSRGSAITGQAIAVNYPARAFGIKRGMDCNEMRRLCPIIQLCRVPSIEGVEKGDITKYRDASGEIFKALVEFSDNIVVEKASIDEAFLDLTLECEKELDSRTAEEWVEKLNADAAELLPTTFLVNEDDKQHTVLAAERLNCLREWFCTDCRLSKQQLAIAIGATVVERIRKRVKQVTQFNCSAGIAHNKILAKLVCARHKPACQSVIVPQHIPTLYSQTPINSVRNLGGKFGRRLMRHFNATLLADLRGISREELLKYFHHKNVDWLTRLLEGENDEPICSNLQPKSLGTSKNFPAAQMLTSVSSVKKWIEALSSELSRRLIADDDKYGRVAQTLVIGFSTCVGEHNVRTMHLPNYTPSAIQQTCWNYVKPFNREKDGYSWYPHVSCMYMSASRFEAVGPSTRRITEFFRKDGPAYIGAAADDACNSSGDDDDVIILDEQQNVPKGRCDGNEDASAGELIDHATSCDDGKDQGSADDEILIVGEKRNLTSSNNNANNDSANNTSTTAVPPTNRRTKGRRRKNGTNCCGTRQHRRRDHHHLLISSRRITDFFHQPAAADFACALEAANCGSGADEIIILENKNASRSDEDGTMTTMALGRPSPNSGPDDNQHCATNPDNNNVDKENRNSLAGMSNRLLCIISS